MCSNIHSKYVESAGRYAMNDQWNTDPVLKVKEGSFSSAVNNGLKALKCFNSWFRRSFFKCAAAAAWNDIRAAKNEEETGARLKTSAADLDELARSILNGQAAIS
ncbi:hypothetical protein T07_4571 [Trichinella nelsoni]|uniref:Uncharacterized protein n=1 Tax=Trichinella nelsoni TaxID=6336 RepID=A0A0V0RMZ4_9BILA|nr:hypothetical protein T07_4571 [Trichinella nelsoni]